MGRARLPQQIPRSATGRDFLSAQTLGLARRGRAHHGARSVYRPAQPGGQRTVAMELTETEQPDAGATRVDPSPGPQRPRPHWLRRIVVAGVSLVALAVVLFVLQMRQPSEVQRFEQPSSVTYADGRTHLAVLWHVETPASKLGLSNSHYELLLGSSPEHGHIVRVEADGLAPADLDVSWEPDGARVTYGSGRELFVPAESFTFGR